MPTLSEIKNYLRIDFDDDDNLLAVLSKTAEEYLKSAINQNYDASSERAKMLALVVIAELYENRELTPKANSTISKLVHDFGMQLQMESRG